MIIDLRQSFLWPLIIRTRSKGHRGIEIQKNDSRSWPGDDLPCMPTCNGSVMSYTVWRKLMGQPRTVKLASLTTIPQKGLKTRDLKGTAPMSFRPNPCLSSLSLVRTHGTVTPGALLL